MITDEDIGDFLRRKIEERGISANALAAESGIDQVTISKFLKGRDIRISTAQKLMRVLKCRISDVSRSKRGRVSS